VKVACDPQVGHEQAGWRPALVISPKLYNAMSSVALLCPITTRAKGYPFEVVLPPELPIDGVILVDQLRAMDWRGRRAQLVARAPADVVREVLGRLEPLVT
jgi:mRNA interferase MazF